MKKICMITGLAGPGSVAGGVWEVVVHQAQALRAAGYDVSIAAGWLGSDPPAELRGLDVHLIPVRPIVQKLGLRFVVGKGWAHAVEDALAGADLAHVHLCRDYLTTAATRTAERAGVPIVAQTHGMLGQREVSLSSPVFWAFDRLITKPALARAAAFVTLTDDEAPSLVSLGVPTSAISTVENVAPEPTVTWRERFPASPAHLLFVSRLHPRKQVMVFARMVEELRGMGYSAEGTVVGPDQGDLPALKAFIASRRDSFLHYAGELSRERIAVLMSEATAFVFPAQNEPYGLVLIEALSVGVPIVTTNQTPLARDLVTAGAAIATSPDISSMPIAIRRLLDSPELGRELSTKGQALFRSRWTTGAMVKALNTIYENVQ